MGTRSFGGQHLCLPKICWTQNIGVHLELKENLELECGPAQPDLFNLLSSSSPTPTVSNCLPLELIELLYLVFLAWQISGSISINYSMKVQFLLGSHLHQSLQHKYANQEKLGQTVEITIDTTI